MSDYVPATDHPWRKKYDAAIVKKKKQQKTTNTSKSEKIVCSNCGDFDCYYDECSGGDF